MTRERDVSVRKQILMAIHHYNRDCPVLTHESRDDAQVRRRRRHALREARHAAEQMAMMPYVPPELMEQYAEYQSVVSRRGYHDPHYPYPPYTRRRQTHDHDSRRHRTAPLTTNKIQTCA